MYGHMHRLQTCPTYEVNNCEEAESRMNEEVKDGAAGNSCMMITQKTNHIDSIKIVLEQDRTFRLQTQRGFWFQCSSAGESLFTPVKDENPSVPKLATTGCETELKPTFRLIHIIS